MLPFTVDEFFGVFRAYNEAVWPAQPLLVGLALIALWLAIRPNRWSNPAIAAILGFFWLWLGLAYHLAFFAAINPLAYAFSAVSVFGGLAFIWSGVIRHRIQFQISMNKRSGLGLLLIVFSLLVYPAWSVLAGHRYPAFPRFGLPCPTTLFTVGMLAFLTPPYPRAPFIVPVLWCLVGAQAAFLLGVHQDIGLLAAAGVGIFLLVRSKSSGPPEPRAR
jgi:hypothetical protein